MIKDKDEAMKKLAFVKGYLNDVALNANQPVELIKLHLTFLDEVQLFINPNANLNKIQEEINKK